MKVTTKLDEAKIKSRFNKGRDLAQKELGNMVMTDSNRFIPKDTGVLEESVRVEKDGKQVVWSTPYAERVYYGENMEISRQKNPNASSKWFEIAKALNLKNWIERVKFVINANGGEVSE